MRIVRSFSAGIVLVALLVGIPAALWALRGNPLPAGVPELDGMIELVTRPDRDGSFLLGFLTWAGWAGWATFTAGFVLECLSMLRRAPMPRVPGLGFQRQLAAGLISAVFLTGTTVAGTGLAEAHPPVDTAGAAPATANITAGGAPEAGQAQTATTPAEHGQNDQQADSDAGVVDYTVGPGDSLWSIAETELGDGHRWGEIAEANYGRQQPDGRALGEDHWLQPGWVLRLPAAEPEAAPESANVASHPGEHVVEAGDTLAGIAAEYLDSASSWPTIAEANPQIDHPDLIYPGQVLTLPAENAGQDDSQAEDGNDSQSPDAEADADTDTSPDEQPSADQDDEARHGDPAGKQQDNTGAGNEPQPDSALAEVDSTFPTSTIGGVGALLAAGLIGHLLWRRRAQNSQRRPGQDTPPLPTPAAEVESQLAAVADPLGRDQVDTALRALAVHCAHTSRPLPTVHAARLTADTFELYLTSAAELPDPWVAAPEHTVWALHIDDLEQLPTAEADTWVSAPYPALAVIGQDTDEAHILLDLEHVGALTLSGPVDTTAEIITALGLELGLSDWADDLGLTMVGPGDELPAVLDTGRITHIERPDDLITRLHHRAAHEREQLEHASADSASSARSNDASGDLWAPEVILIATELDNHQQQQLDEIVHQLPRVGVAAVTTGNDPLTEWCLRITGTETAVLDPVGLILRPQRIDEASYASAVDMLRATHTAPAGASPHPPEVAVADLPTQRRHSPHDGPHHDTTTGTPMENQPPHSNGPTAPTTEATRELADQPERPYIRLLGEVAVLGATGPLQSSHVGTVTEIAAYIATHPGTSGAGIQEHIWPGEPARDKTRQEYISRLHRWLGADPSTGEPYLPNATASTGYAFSAAVDTDWDTLGRLIADGPTAAETADLDTALDLVHGDPVSWTKRSRRPKYRWAELLRMRMRREISDIAAERARRALRAGDGHSAIWAARVGLRVEPGMQTLWRDLLKGTYLTGDTADLNTVSEEMYRTLENLGAEPAADTNAVVDDLLEPPGHESTGAAVSAR